METLHVKLTGIAPLLMHNGRLADPQNEHAKQLSAVVKDKARKNTDEGRAEARLIEFLGGLYTHDGAPCIPSDLVLACVVEGAKQAKLGKLAKAAVYEAAEAFPLIYDGPKEPLQLYEQGGFADYRSVKNPGQSARVMRSRPIFRKWSVIVSVIVNTDLLKVTDVVRAFEVAGERVGLGDYRPRYGRFTVEVLKSKAKAA